MKSSSKCLIKFVLLTFIGSLANENLIFVGKCLDVSTWAVRSKFAVDEIGYNGSGIRVAVLDSGIDATHPDFQGKPIIWRDFVNGRSTSYDDYGHGTHVAGILCGAGLASKGVYKGVAPGVTSLIIGKVVDQKGELTDPSRLVNALEWAVDAGAQVISLSVGIQRRWFNQSYCDGTCDLCRAVDDCVRRGVVVVVGAGDEGLPRSQYPNNPFAVTSDGYSSLRCPATAFDVITVGATNDTNTKSIKDDKFALVTPSEDPPYGWASSRGPTADGRPKPDVMAPGVHIWSPDPVGDAGYSAGDYCDFNGTSAAAPLVAGVAALILQAHPKWTPSMVKYALKATANLNDILQPLTENDRGKGIADATRTVSLPITEIPPDQADSNYTSHTGNADAIAYLNGTFRIGGGGWGEDTEAEARLSKTFILSQKLTSPTFFFGFHDLGHMTTDSNASHAMLNATLKLWQGDTILSSAQEIIHSLNGEDDQNYNCFHTIKLTYQGFLNPGQSYKLEYGFRTHTHIASLNFYDFPWNITALHLTAIGIVGPGNPSFEERGGSIYDSGCWANNRIGWRYVRGNLNHDNVTDATDVFLWRQAYISPIYNWTADFNGNNEVDYLDLNILRDSYVYDYVPGRKEDGIYSWNATGGGDCTLSQWLCDHDVNIVKGRTVQFRYYFKPKTWVSNGSKNYARAEIYYITDTGSSETIIGLWAKPKKDVWYWPVAQADIPANTIAIKVTIYGTSDGTPDFKAWIDKTFIAIPY